MSDSEYFTLFKRAQLAEAAAHSVGGYIITPEGDLASLNEACVHYHVCEELYGKDECTAQELGLIRVSFAGRSHEMGIEWMGDHVTIAALQALRAILPKHPDRYSFTFEIDRGLYEKDLYRAALDLTQARGLITRAIAARMPAKAAA
jgi:hypothetical protein